MRNTDHLRGLMEAEFLGRIPLECINCVAHRNRQVMLAANTRDSAMDKL